MEKIQPQLFSVRAEKLLREGNFLAVNEEIKKYELQKYLHPELFDQLRLDRVKRNFNEAQRHVESIELFCSDNNEFSRVDLRSLDDYNICSPVFVHDYKEVDWTKEGLYIIKGKSGRGFFEENKPSGLKEEYFSSRSFNKKIPKDFNERIWIGRGVRFAHLISNTKTAFDENLSYMPSRSNYMSRRTSVHAVKKATRHLPFALVLPIPYSSRNYYHSFAEMIYGLRLISYLSIFDYYIVHDEDNFGLVNFYADIMGIPSTRLLKYKDVLDTSFGVAVMPDSPPFYWDGKFISFFSNLLASAITREDVQSSRSRIYISRSRSSRSLPNEQLLENELKNLSFHIVHAEELTHLDQIYLFRNAEFIVSPHGAGLTNIVFSKKKVKLLEIFDGDYVVPDFYYRSLHLECDYSCYVVSDPIGYIREIVDKCF